jgi:hypothetical protein
VVEKVGGEEREIERGGRFWPAKPKSHAGSVLVPGAQIQAQTIGCVYGVR